MAKEKVLVVEDEAIVQLDIRNRLTNLGYEIIGTVAYGEDAVKKTAEKTPDLVLMDIGLKGKVDGIEAANQIKAIYNIPIIYMTANSDYTTLQKAKITGPFGYILKPFDEREMRTTIEMALYKHRLDAELNETRHWLETTLKSIGDGVISTNSEMCITFMNPAAEAMTGWKAVEAQGKNIADVVIIVDTETGQKAECPAHKVMETGLPCASKGLLAIVSRDGSECPADCTVSPTFDDKHRIDGLVFVFRDVSEKRRAMEALRVSEARLARAFAIAHMGNWDFDVTEGKIWLSDESKRIFDIQSQESEFDIGVIRSRVLPEDLAIVDTMLAELKPETKSITFGFRIRRQDGEVRYIQDEAEFIWDKRGKTIRMFGTNRDVTDQVLVEQALRESEDKFSQAFHYNPLPMTISTLEDGKFVDINRRFTETFGYDKGDSIGKTSIEIGLISSSDRALLIEQINRQGRITNVNFNFHAKNGSCPSGLASYDVIVINGKKHLLAVFYKRSGV